MASRINICSVNFLNNPSAFTEQLQLEITFEVFEFLPHDIEWELVYVGSGTSREYDQLLDSVVVGPTPEGRHRFVFTADPPKVEKIPTDDVVGVSVLLLRCKYNTQEFINLGWFVSNEYTEEELKENPPAKPITEKMIRKVQIDDLRVTTFSIKWAEGDEVYPVEAVEESEKVFDEADLLPLEEDPDQQDDEEDSDSGEEGEGEVDLDKSMEKVNGAASGDMDEQMETDDCEMEDVSNEKLAANQQPLGDMTNEDVVA